MDIRNEKFHKNEIFMHMVMHMIYAQPIRDSFRKSPITSRFDSLRSLREAANSISNKILLHDEHQSISRI